MTLPTLIKKDSTGYGTFYGPDKHSKLTDDEIKKFITERDMSLTNVLMKGEPDRIT